MTSHVYEFQNTQFILAFDYGYALTALNALQTKWSDTDNLAEVNMGLFSVPPLPLFFNFNFFSYSLLHDWTK